MRWWNSHQQGNIGRSHVWGLKHHLDVCNMMSMIEREPQEKNALFSWRMFGFLRLRCWFQCWDRPISYACFPVLFQCWRSNVKNIRCWCMVSKVLMFDVEADTSGWKTIFFYFSWNSNGQRLTSRHQNDLVGSKTWERNCREW